MKKYLPKKYMENKKFAIFLAALLSFLLLPGPAYAWTVYDVGSQPWVKRNIDNYDNWPYEMRRQCIIEQSRAVLECSQQGNKNWMVRQTIAGSGKIDGKNISMFYAGAIYGNYECDVPDIGAHTHIYSRAFESQRKSKSKDSNDRGFAEFSCSFVCESWNCSAEKRDGGKKFNYPEESVMCTRFLYIDRDWDEIDDITGETIEDISKKWIKQSEELICKGLEKELEKKCEFKVLSSDFKSGYENNLEEYVYEICWYCSCLHIKKPPKTTLRKNDLKRVKKLLERYEKYDLIQKKIDSLNQETYTIPPYLKNNKVNFVIYDGNNELTTVGIAFREKAEIDEGGFKDANIICEAQFEEIVNIKTLSELVGLAEKKCRGTDFLTDIMLNVSRFFKEVVEIFHYNPPQITEKKKSAALEPYNPGSSDKG